MKRKDYEFMLDPDAVVGFLALLREYGFTNIERMAPVENKYTKVKTVMIYATGTEEGYKKLMEEMNR